MHGIIRKTGPKARDADPSQKLENVAAKTRLVPGCWWWPEFQLTITPESRTRWLWRYPYGALKLVISTHGKMVREGGFSGVQMMRLL